MILPLSTVEDWLELGRILLLAWKMKGCLVRHYNEVGFFGSSLYRVNCRKCQKGFFLIDGVWVNERRKY